MKYIDSLDRVCNTVKRLSANQKEYVYSILSNDVNVIILIRIKQNYWPGPLSKYVAEKI